MFTAALFEVDDSFLETVAFGKRLEPWTTEVSAQRGK
jgi:hypothetical protein